MNIIGFQATSLSRQEQDKIRAHHITYIKNNLNRLSDYQLLQVYNTLKDNYVRLI